MYVIRIFCILCRFQTQPYLKAVARESGKMVLRQPSHSIALGIESATLVAKKIGNTLFLLLFPFLSAIPRSLIAVDLTRVPIFIHLLSMWFSLSTENLTSFTFCFENHWRRKKKRGTRFWLNFKASIFCLYVEICEVFLRRGKTGWFSSGYNDRRDIPSRTPVAIQILIPEVERCKSVSESLGVWYSTAI